VALDTSGGGYLTVANNALLSHGVDEAFTAMARVTVSGALDGNILATVGSGLRGWAWRLRTTDPRELEFQLIDTFPTWLQVRADAGFADGENTHLCTRYNGDGTVDIFYDGALQATTTLTDTPPVNTNSTVALGIGARQDGTNKVACTISDVRVYKGRVLSDQEILTIATDEGPDAIVDSLSARWLADPAEYSVGDTPAEVIDYSANALGATSTSSPVWTDSKLRGT